ncbi:hypothetical protein AB6N23_08570 [Cellulomonas sp. 179-A 9B4 NHS]|uniref:hypothetical protein n=1 Tax=Cellulomonas sp. 179-A 9B4 NHS TaxID=3142379 RepID=UPI0039A1EA3A
MRGTPSPVRHDVPRHDVPRHPASRRGAAASHRHPGTRALAAVVAGLLAGVLTAVVAAPALAVAPAPVDRGAGLPAAPAGPGLPAPGGGAEPLATIEDEEDWCSYLSSYYLAFPSPWSARVYNCQHRSMFVAPVFSDGSAGMCVLVPARHSRHLGGNVARWVTDIRVC